MSILNSTRYKYQYEMGKGCMYIGYIIHLREFSDDIDFADGCRVSACLCFLFFIDYCAVKSFVFCCSLCAAIVHGARF